MYYRNVMHPEIARRRREVAEARMMEIDAKVRHAMALIAESSVISELLGIDGQRLLDAAETIRVELESTTPTSPQGAEARMRAVDLLRAALPDLEGLEALLRTDVCERS